MTSPRATKAELLAEIARLQRRVRALERERTGRESQAADSEQRRAATAEILRVIAASRTDAQPVFEAIIDNAVRLCRGLFAGVARRDGDRVLMVANNADRPAGLARAYPAAIDSSLLPCRAIYENAVIHIPDTEAPGALAADPLALSRVLAVRSILVVPMRVNGEPIGSIIIVRRERAPFSRDQISLLEMFADQAVIAIENARLFTQLREKNGALIEALNQQTATSEILKVISQSPTDAQPVFQAILDSAKRLLRGNSAVISRVIEDRIELAAYTRTDAAGDALLESLFPMPLQSGGGDARPIRERVIGERVPYNVADVEADPRVGERGRANARARGYRSQLVVPMLRDDGVIGTIAVTRPEPVGFAAEEVALLQTFADQAVIAIENVRLFTELQDKNRALTEALDQQTATAEILRAISSSPTDVQPVFDAIAETAYRLCGSLFSAVFRFDGERLHLAAHHNFTREASQAYERVFPAPPTRYMVAGRAILDRIVAQTADIESGAIETGATDLRQAARTLGVRSILSVPMLRGTQPLGCITVFHSDPIPFTERQVALLQTFAHQAVIAIENARLFTELQQRTRDLARSVDQLTALGEVSHAVSSTLDLDRVLNTVVARASELAGADGCSIYEYDEDARGFRMRATSQIAAEVAQRHRQTVIPAGEGAVGRLVDTRAPVQIPDIADESAYQSPLRDVLIGGGYRALLAVPMLHENRVVGNLVVSRKTAGAFPAETVELLTTFANQSALAIANARLFREIEDKSAQLEIANQHKSEFLANMSHELRTPLNAVIGFSDVLLEGMFGEVNEKQTEYLRDILSSGQHLLSLINDILDLSKIEAGRMELEVTEFDVPQAIDNALTLMRERAMRHGVALSHVLDDRVGTIVADERKFKQVLLNLLSNAVKFTPAGGKVEVRARHAGDRLEVAVADTGEGIAPEDQNVVFEEFRQVGTSSKKVEGTGLGLALCRKFVELHGGGISLESQVGVGSTFTFWLPRRSG